MGEWCAPVSGPEQGFRNKAKMVVSGSVEKPLLGMLHRDGTPEDLTDCPLYPASFAPVFAVLKPFIARAGLTPYNVARKRGELKYLLLTESTLERRRHDAALRAALGNQAGAAARRAAVAAGAAAAAEGHFGEYSAGAYGDHGRGEGDFSPTSRRWRKASTACRCGSARKASSRPTRPWPAALYATARDWVRA